MQNQRPGRSCRWLPISFKDAVLPSPFEADLISLANAAADASTTKFYGRLASEIAIVVELVHTEAHDQDVLARNPMGLAP